MLGVGGNSVGSFLLLKDCVGRHSVCISSNPSHYPPTPKSF